MTGRPAQPPAEAPSSLLSLAPLGIPLYLAVGRAPEPNAIRAACARWEGPAGPAAGSLRLRIDHCPRLAGTGEAGMRVGADLVTVRGPGVQGFAELARGRARCAVSREYLGDAEALRQEVLEPLVLMLLSRRDRTPLHASGFVCGDLAVLLAGRSGAGKSCLAHAADRAGMQVLSDDTVFVGLAPSLSIWGWPSAAHLFEGDAPDAPGPLRWRRGKAKRVVQLRSASTRAVSCERAALCLLARGGGPMLRPITSAEARERMWPLDEGFALLEEQIGRAVDRLAAGGAWELRLSDDPAAAIELLRANLPRLQASAAR